MKTTDPFEQKLNQLGQRLGPHPDFDEKIMDHILHSIGSPQKKRIIRLGAKSLSWLASAAAAIIIATVFFNVLPSDPTIALANTIKSMQQQWVYLSFSEDDNPFNTYECWIYTHGGIKARRDQHGTTFINLKQEKSYHYVPSSNLILIEYPWDELNNSDQEKESEANSILNRAYSELRLFQRIIKNLKLKPQVHGGTYQGYDVQIQDYFKSDFSSTKPWLTLYIDPDRTLLRGYNNWPTLVDANNNPIRILHHQATFDFPTAGPNDIYDLDVPRDTQVINRIDLKFIGFWKTYRTFSRVSETQSELARKTWPQLMRDSTLFEDDYSRQHRLIGVERIQKQDYYEKEEVQNARFRFYFDPAKNYLCQKEEVHWETSEAMPAHMWIHEVKDYQQINGLWYPKTIETWLTNDLKNQPLYLSRTQSLEPPH